VKPQLAAQREQPFRIGESDQQGEDYSLVERGDVFYRPSCNVLHNTQRSGGTMSTRRMSHQHRISFTPGHSGVVSVAYHARPAARPAAPNEDALIAARRQIIDPLWVITGALGILFALLAMLTAAG
jgi:hypothetical protein